MYQAGVITTISDDSLDPILLTKGLVAADELDLNTCLEGEMLGMFTQFISQRLCPTRIVEQPDLVVTKVACHGARITDIRERSGDDDTIKAGKYASDLILVAFDERIHDGYPLFLLLSIRIGDTENLVPAMPG